MYAILFRMNAMTEKDNEKNKELNSTVEDLREKVCRLTMVNKDEDSMKIYLFTVFTL